MEIRIQDWIFQVDWEKTFFHTQQNAKDHCTCDYCQNYYDSVDLTYPMLRLFLEKFGIVLDGLSELMPFEPTLILACYRVHGSIISWGTSDIYLDDIRITIEEDENNTFLLWVGEMELPWCQNIAKEDVISPANTHEFLYRMLQVLRMRYSEADIFS